MRQSPLRFVTGNAGKLREAEAFLKLKIEGVHADLDELQTTDLDNLATHKAMQAYQQVGHPVMVEDTALVFNAWGALPGPFIKFFLGEMGTGDLVRALGDFSDKSAEAICAVGLHDGREVHVFQGRVSGKIVPPRGSGGFGWDPIFQPDESQKTFAEMELNEKQRFSMRAKALAALAEYLAVNPLAVNQSPVKPQPE